MTFKWIVASEGGWFWMIKNELSGGYLSAGVLPSVIPFGWNIQAKDLNIVEYVTVIIIKSSPNNSTIQNF